MGDVSDFNNFSLEKQLLKCSSYAKLLQ